MTYRATPLIAALLAFPSVATAQTASVPAAASNTLTLPTVPPATTAAPKERVICRRDIEIGSLVKGVRRCATVAEWRKADEAARDTTDRMLSDKGRYCGPGQGSC